MSVITTANKYAFSQNNRARLETVREDDIAGLVAMLPHQYTLTNRVITLPRMTTPPFKCPKLQPAVAFTAPGPVFKMRCADLKH